MIPNPANYSTISFPLLGIEVDPIRTISLGPLTIHLYGAVIALGCCWPVSIAATAASGRD